MANRIRASFRKSARSPRAGDGKHRKDVLDSLQELRNSIEKLDDTVQRFTFYNLQMAALRVGIDLSLFSSLVESEKPLAVGRMLRYLASFGAIKETEKDTFTSTNISSTFALLGFQAAICHYANTALQRAFNTTQPAFFWLQTQPEKLALFQEYLTTNCAGMSTFLDAYPVREHPTALHPERVFFVDAIAFRNRYRDLAGRVVVQDLAPTLQHAIQHAGVEMMEQDFFQLQGIKGAKFCYFRNIFHDWPDNKARIILQNTIEAMAEDSIILVDDMVLLNAGVHWQAAQLDILTMTMLAARERTQEQWDQLLQSAELKATSIQTYTASLEDSVIEAAPV
ncbi:S-adenosyl-L-methionine-dependent methyltransferase [Aspergillus brunneoviolaceus CBS 621.78]|uniref:S-adenosyl-L-methionine-dependent methyltransferase n=1 Tax=Aspergillus brunneoviolaceus CBS 621.78 TaxID=1450534 RepID=A0ACD1GM37_9EURO|nr:S-adenosyl-L-methionine-dependent methyltransferase [Aspergillus brunneoviolaceus CBS 621.78]RAH50260.1 S-adenosyl-L-methionine-dependent methyltransferase [Aspergillus brunneoviolaceus CBS 621.78]